MGTGKVEWSYPAPKLPVPVKKPIKVRDDFEEERLADKWIFGGTPYTDFYKIENGSLVINLLPAPLSPELKKIELAEGGAQVYQSLSLIARRQCHVHFSACAKLHFHSNADNETAGFVIMQANNHQFRFERAALEGSQILRVVQITCDFSGLPFMPEFTSKTTETVIAQSQVEDQAIILKITAVGRDYAFYYGYDEVGLIPLCEHVDGRKINPENVGGMVGTLIGMFASSNDIASTNRAAFDWFDYMHDQQL